VAVKLSEILVEKSDPNLRKPFVNVVKDDDSIIPISADINAGAADNKFVAAVLGRTGAYCTACKCEASDMVGIRPLEPYYMDCGVRDVRDIFEDNFVAAYGELESRTEGDADRVLPSAAGDYRRRFGAKHAPMTDSLETTKVTTCALTSIARFRWYFQIISVLHSSLLNTWTFLVNYFCRVAAGCHKWGPGRTPKVGTNCALKIAV
jgi:hypothetical protein